MTAPGRPLRILAADVIRPDERGVREDQRIGPHVGVSIEHLYLVNQPITRVVLTEDEALDLINSLSRSILRLRGRSAW